MAKILIVDDSPTETYKLTGILERNGFSVLSADSGEQGVNLARDEQPDVVLMDIVMPGLNGFQATRQLSRSLKRASAGKGGFCDSAHHGTAVTRPLSINWQTG